MTEAKGVMVKSDVQLTEDDYASIQSFEDAVRLVQQTMGGEIVNAADELGDGFILVKDEDKDKLVGVPMLLISWSFNAGDFGKTFVSVRAITSKNEKVIVNDGGSGIRDQLDKYDGQMGGLFVPHGLRKSEYGLNADNEPVPMNDPTRVSKGTTYYLDTSK